jgi:hypothetical protein
MALTIPGDISAVDALKVDALIHRGVGSPVTVVIKSPAGGKSLSVQITAS